jgi:hypothetical protein
LYNASPRKLTLDYQDLLCTIEFHKLSMPSQKVIAPDEDLINGKIPESDRVYLRSLETTSLSEIDKNMRTLIQSVNSLTNVVYKFLLPIMVAVFAGVVIAVLKGITK